MQTLRTSLIVSSLFTLSTVAPLVAEPTWQPTPIGARSAFTHWAAHSNGTTLYAEPHRLVRSDDAGRSWRRVPSAPDFTIYVGEPYLHPANPEIVVAEAAVDIVPDGPTGAIAVSLDGGATWTRRALPARGLDPIGFDGRGSFYAGFDHHVFRSDDLGATWVDISLPEGSRATTVAFADPGSGNAAGILGSHSRSWVVSTDGGRTFSVWPTPATLLPSSSVMAPDDNRRWLLGFSTGISITRDGFATTEVLQGLDREASHPQFHPRRTGWLFANHRSPTTSGAGVVAFSTDDGATWNTVEVPARWFEAELLFDPCDDETWYIQSESEGLVRVTASGEVVFLNRDAPNRRVVSAVARPAACELILETEGGFFALADRGETWRRLGVGLAAPSARGFVFDPLTPGRILAPTQGGLALSTDHGRSWDPVPAFDGLSLESVALGARPGHLAWLASRGGVLYRSEDGGQTARDVAFPVRRIVPDPWAPDDLLVQDGIAPLWTRRSDLGATASHPLVGGDGFALELVAFAPHEPGLLYAYSASVGHFYISRDGGRNFEKTADFDGIAVPRFVSSGLRVDGDGTIYLFDTARVARSNDGGASFDFLPAIDALPAGSYGITDVVPDRHAPDTVSVVGLAREPGESRLLLLRSDDDGTTFRDGSAGALLSADGFGTIGQSPDDPDLELFGGRTVYRRDGTDACASADVLCLRGERFEVSLHFGSPADGAPSIARAVAARTLDSGLFTFFDAENWELMVKVLDGCGLNERFWVLAAATTDRAYTLRLTDRASGSVREYINAPGRRSPAIIDTDAFASCEDPFPGAVTPAVPTVLSRAPAALRSATPAPTSNGCPTDRLCLRDDRFQVATRWLTTEGAEGAGLPLDIRSADSGLFAFFTPSNWEMMVKVLDACAINGRYWVLGAATTDVGYEIVITDTRDGSERIYSNPVGDLSPAIIDVDAFACAP